MLTGSVLAIRSEAHHFAFISVFAVADEVADHCVEGTERMRQKHAFKNFDLVSFAACHHGRHKIAGTVVTESRGLLPRGAVVGAGNVRYMVFKMMLPKPHRLRIDVECFGYQRTHIPAALLALAEADQVCDLGWICSGVRDFFRQIGVT